MTEALLLHRSMLVPAGLAPPIDGVTTVFTETETVTDDFRYARRLGMSAKLCIHPTQVAAVHAAAAPTDTEAHWAKKIVESAGASSPPPNGADRALMCVQSCRGWILFVVSGRPDECPVRKVFSRNLPRMRVGRRLKQIDIWA